MAVVENGQHRGKQEKHTNASGMWNRWRGEII